jgi:hypothetical protein
MDDPVQQSTALPAQTALSLFNEAGHLGLSECPDSEPDRAGAEGAILWFVRQSA